MFYFFNQKYENGNESVTNVTKKQVKKKNRNIYETHNFIPNFQINNFLQKYFHLTNQ